MVSFDDQDVLAEDLKPSEILKREVYRKESRGSVMVKKFILLKTNKEQSSEYPAYVYHLTDFSSGRKDPLKKEVKVSDSIDQMEELCAAELIKNIKAGWEIVK